MLPTPSPDVIFAPLDGGAVIFSTSEEVYYGLNAVGVRVWELLPPATTSLDELCNTLHGEFADVELEIIRGDVTELLEELARLGLVAVAGDGAADVARREMEAAATTAQSAVAARSDGIAERAT